MRNLVVVGAIALGALGLTGCGVGDFDRWVSSCYQYGGVPQIVSSSYYECFKDGQQFVVPGWEDVND